MNTLRRPEVGRVFRYGLALAGVALTGCGANHRLVERSHPTPVSSAESPASQALIAQGMQDIGQEVRGIVSCAEDYGILDMDNSGGSDALYAAAALPDGSQVEAAVDDFGRGAYGINQPGQESVYRVSANGDEVVDVILTDEHFTKVSMTVGENDTSFIITDELRIEQYLKWAQGLLKNMSPDTILSPDYDVMEAEGLAPLRPDSCSGTE